jgi:DNA-binding phage protein
LETVSGGKLMPRRSQDWNKGLAEDLSDPKFAKEFIIAALEDGVDLKNVLKKVILAIGLKEFAKKLDMKSPNLSRVLGPKGNPTQETFDRLLKPFGLKLSVASLPKKKAA